MTYNLTPEGRERKRAAARVQMLKNLQDPEFQARRRAASNAKLVERNRSAEGRERSRRAALHPNVEAWRGSPENVAVLAANARSPRNLEHLARINADPATREKMKGTRGPIEVPPEDRIRRSEGARRLAERNRGRRYQYKDPRTCIICGAEFAASHLALYCPVCKFPRVGETTFGHYVPHLRRRDGDNCGVCGEPIDFTLPGIDPRGPTVDHVNAAGPRTDLSNMQLAHWRCNCVVKRLDVDRLQRGCTPS